MYGTIAIILVFAGAAAWYSGAFNRLIGAVNTVDQSWADVEVELKRRLDLITAIIETVKRYVTHERETLLQVTQARGAAASALSPAAAGVREGPLRRALVSLIAVVEAYPTLKADHTFLDLQKQLVETENRIAEKRIRYNRVVRDYTILSESFPSVLVARLHAFARREYFDIPDEEGTMPGLGSLLEERDRRG